MSRNIWCLLGLLLLSVFVGSDADCDYVTKLEPRRSYRITNPGYPRLYQGSTLCRWRAISDTRVKFYCPEFNIPRLDSTEEPVKDLNGTENCAGDSLNVFTSPTNGGHKFCNGGGFWIESEGNEMVITLTTAYNTPGGSFNCALEATAPDEVPECECGWKDSSKVSGGTETGVNEYPMMAGIVNLRYKQVFCGATIISRKHVLTAAHCVSQITVNDIGVLTGDHDLSTGGDTWSSKIHQVAKIKMHPYYNDIRKKDDIAIITIADSITFTNAISPACLPFRHYRDSFAGTLVTVLGWGLTEFAGASSLTLQKAPLAVPNLQTCKQYFPNMDNSQICTYADGRDSCQMDSGGPLLWENPTTRRIVLAGIISYGTVCASKTPAINTRVGEYLSWIVSETPGVQFCQAE